MSGKIDGVPREFLEVIANSSERSMAEINAAIQQARELLAAPVVERQPVAVDAAKSFAKGFNTLETAGGKYKIVMQFAGHDDAWTAYSALGNLVKELNQ